MDDTIVHEHVAYMDWTNIHHWHGEYPSMIRLYENISTTFNELFIIYFFLTVSLTIAVLYSIINKVVFLAV